MSEREERRGGSGCAMAGIALILLPVLYVLGIGPPSPALRIYLAAVSAWLVEA